MPAGLPDIHVIATISVNYFLAGWLDVTMAETHLTDGCFIDSLGDGCSSRRLRRGDDIIAARCSGGESSGLNDDLYRFGE